jgi:hypothetical protein
MNIRRITTAGPNESIVRAHGEKLAFCESYAPESAFNTKAGTYQDTPYPYSTFRCPWMQKFRWMLSMTKQYLARIMQIHSQNVKVGLSKESNVLHTGRFTYRLKVIVSTSDSVQCLKTLLVSVLPSEFGMNIFLPSTQIPMYGKLNYAEGFAGEVREHWKDWPSMWQPEFQLPVDRRT